MLYNIPPGVQRQVETGISILTGGGVIAFPTDTVYGLGASMNSSEAVKRIYQVKGRLRQMALPLLLADTSQISLAASVVPPIARLLAARFLPGALTIVLQKSRLVPDIITGERATVAVRVPAHPIPVTLARGIGAPIVGTSANLSGQPNLLSAGEVSAQFGDRIDLVIDAGRCPGGRESTIIDVTGEVPVVLREGAVSREELERVCGSILKGG